ncbi:MAG: hypothetical protein M4579_005789 [Chaenotheca gracillima]|nr:MAG: hypothetical protein M4579_005789 [Chaenotheca gracillima]
MGLSQQITLAIAVASLALSGRCATAATSADHDVGAYCKLLDAQVPGRVAFSGNPAYNSSESSYYTGQESELRPGCIFQPQQTSEVADFMRLITGSVKGCSTKPRFAVRCGGHTPYANAANVDGGITVDMRTMNTTTLSADKKVASIGGGGIWSNVYDQLSPYDLTVMGGRQAGLGVGGLGTGGGVHFLSREHGWVCDNIYAYEIALANGTVVTATATAHRDLWLALKGGTNNFGIVTRFDAATFDLNAMWGGALVLNYTQAVLDRHAQAFSDFMLPQNFDAKAHGGTALVYMYGQYEVVDTIYYTAPVKTAPAWKNFTSIQPQILNTLGLSTAAKLVNAGTGQLPVNATRGNFLTLTFKTGPAAVYSQLFKIWEDESKSMQGIPGISLVWLIQPQPVTNGTNAMGNEPGRKDLVTAGFINSWASKDDDEAVAKGTGAIYDKQVAYLKQQGLYVPFKYMNYADISQDVIGSYGAAAKASLQATSRRHDPQGVFQKQISGGFKLGL